MIKKLSALICAITMLLSAARAENALLYMINVGKGDAIIVQVSGKNYLIDAGKADAWDTIEKALKRLGIKKLDGVFMTHTDKDHSGGLKKLAKSNIDILAWYAAALCSDRSDDNPIVKAADKREMDVTWLKAGDIVDGVFTVIGPLSSDKNEENNNSLVMRLDTGYGTVLLAGDMEPAEEMSIMFTDADVSCDVLKVPNHADNDVCLAGMIEKTGAKYALVSTDPYDKPGTPDEFLLSRLENLGMEVFRTDFSERGIKVEFSENGIQVTMD